MNAGKPLWADREQSLEVRLLATPGPDYCATLERTWFGTDGLRYRRLGVAEQLARLPGARFLELRRDGRLVGTYVLARRDVLSGEGALAGWYRGLLTVTEEERGRGHGRLLVRLARDWVAQQAAGDGGGVVSWGCVEAQNAPSLRVLEALGARCWGRLEASTVYRQWPRRRLAVDRLGPGDDASLHNAVLASADDCALRVAPHRVDDYFAVTRGSRIVAGARVIPTRVDMGRIGGAWDAAYAYLLRYLPPARRRFDPRNFFYLRLDDLVVLPGEGNVWKDLLPTLMAAHDAHMAMFVLDPGSRARGLLGEAGLFTRLSMIARQEIRVMGFDWRGDDESGERAGPLGLGPLDL